MPSPQNNFGGDSAVSRSREFPIRAAALNIDSRRPWRVHALQAARRAATKIVFGVGNPQAELMFVGEGPGADEDAQGEPFVGRAGQLLNNMIKAMGLQREDVYIANIVKCRPPGNRHPERDECETCSPFLMRQIAAIKPKVIVALGATAAKESAGDECSNGRVARTLVRLQTCGSDPRGRVRGWP